MKSAGFCLLSNDGGEIVPRAYGKSVSLDVESQEGDAAVIADAISRRI